MTQSKDNETIKLDQINTTVAARNFSNLLNSNKTYLLNGRWGSGKTEFLNQTQKYFNKKFIILDLWQPKDERSIIELSLFKLRPLIYWGIRIAIIIAVVVSILMTNIVNMGLSQYVSSLIIKIAGGIALGVAVFQFFKVKSDRFYSWILIKFPINDKVLVIDDFDRLSNNQQEETYKLFSLLKGKLPIVFVGDIAKINQVEDNYLSKIIDRRVELPFDLHPSSIWDSYFGQLEKTLNTAISQEFRQLVKDELKNLRDREHFNDYVNKEFFGRGKLGHVQIEEQLLVIYVYLFHADFYQGLLNNTIKDISDIYSPEVDKYTHDSSSEYINVLFPKEKEYFSKNNEYPRPFSIDKRAYFIYEQASNMTADELEKLLSSKEKLTKAMLLEHDSDFYQYLTAKYNSFSISQKEELLDLALLYVQKSINSPVIGYIIAEEWRPIKSSGDDKIFEFWDNLLETANFDFSQKLYLLIKYGIFSIHKLGERFPDVSISDESYNRAKKRDAILFIYLSSQDLWRKFENWDRKIWNAINILNDEQYINFWIYQGVLSVSIQYNNYDFNPLIRDYYLCTGRYEFESPTTFRDYQPIVISKMVSRLNKLENEGYHFKCGKDKQYKLID